MPVILARSEVSAPGTRRIHPRSLSLVRRVVRCLLGRTPSSIGYPPGSALDSLRRSRCGRVARNLLISPELFVKRFRPVPEAAETGREANRGRSRRVADAEGGLAHREVLGEGDLPVVAGRRDRSVPAGPARSDQAVGSRSLHRESVRAARRPMKAPHTRFEVARDPEFWDEPSGCRFSTWNR